MASIQESINNLISAGFAGTVGAAYLYKGTPKYEAGELQREVKKGYDILGNADLADEKLGDYYETLRQKEEKIAELNPTEENIKRLEEISYEREEEKDAEKKRLTEKSAQQKAEDNTINRLENKMASQINQKMGFEELKKYVNSMSSLTKDEKKQMTQNFFKAEQREKSKAQSEEAKRKNGTN